MISDSKIFSKFLYGEAYMFVCLFVLGCGWSRNCSGPLSKAVGMAAQRPRRSTSSYLVAEVIVLIASGRRNGRQKAIEVGRGGVRAGNASGGRYS